MNALRRAAALTGLAAAGMLARETQRTAGLEPTARAASVRRKVAVATWRAPAEGRLMTRLVVDAAPVEAYVAERRAAGVKGLTTMHVVGAAAARAMRAVPEANTRVLHGRAVPLQEVSVGFAVDIGRGTDLAPVKVTGADGLTPGEIAAQVWAGVNALRGGTDAGFTLSARVAELCPTALMKPLVLVSSYVLGGLGKPLLGQLGSPLGSVFISNVAPLGVEEVFLAPVPFARTPVYLSIGTTSERAVVRDGQVTAVRQFTLCVTGDHRLVDGVQCAFWFDALLRRPAAPEQLG